jgi:AGCS family alanine or glycine:cation symporter
MTQQAFASGLPGEFGGYIVAISLSFFAFSTMLGWAYYGERSVEYLLGSRAVVPYRLLYIVVIAVAAAAPLSTVWLLSDVMNALMAFPNLLGLLLLSGIVLRETREYFSRYGDGAGEGPPTSRERMRRHGA